MRAYGHAKAPSARKLREGALFIGWGAGCEDHGSHLTLSRLRDPVRKHAPIREGEDHNLLDARQVPLDPVVARELEVEVGATRRRIVRRHLRNTTQFPGKGTCDMRYTRLSRKPSRCILGPGQTHHKSSRGEHLTSLALCQKCATFHRGVLGPHPALARAEENRLRREVERLDDDRALLAQPLLQAIIACAHKAMKDTAIFQRHTSKTPEHRDRAPVLQRVYYTLTHPRGS